MSGSLGLRPVAISRGWNGMSSVRRGALEKSLRFCTRTVRLQELGGGKKNPKHNNIIFSCSLPTCTILLKEVWIGELQTF